MGIKSVRKPQPSLEGRWLWTVFLLVELTQTVTGVVDVTIVSKFQFFDESADTWLSCYHTSSIINQNGFQFGVEVDTGSGTDFTVQRKSYEVTGVRSVNILDSAGNFRVGAFSCRVNTSDGSQTEKAITFKMKSQADVWPVTFTVTANTGDPVTLQMVQKSNRTGTLVWRKDGLDGTVLTGQNGLNLTIASVQSSDEGIYECYYQGDTDRKQGIMRLIVRGCTENKWGPPSCTGDCPVCYNGGVCDDNTGECVCPPGFNGTNCESACANNKIGTSCRECIGGDCTGQLLCVMDPYGCSCAPGLMGIECNTVCPDGMYGAGCTQTCHCARGGSVCDVMTGVCSSGGCEAGWMGNNCQTGCYGTYGPDCNITCGHCYQNQTCDRFDGTCPTGGTHVCAAGYHGDNCHQECFGAYGPDCRTSCGKCYRNQICDRVTGTCPTGGAFVCAAGHSGDKCDQECADSYYGNDCGEICGNCSAGTVCEKTNGRCPGCEDPWVGDTCKMIPATVSEGPESLTAVVENDTTFSCTGRGVPGPSVVWYHGEEIITPGNGIRIDVTDGGLVGEQHVIHSTLTITSVRRQHNGKYVCISSNVAGHETSQEATLVVQERPDDVTVNVTAVNSTTLHVTWSVGVTGNLDIIDSQVRYKRSDTEDWGDWESTGVSGAKGDVYIHSLQLAVMYDVQVRVHNLLGWSDPGSGRMGTTDETGPPESVSVASIIGGSVGAALLVVVLLTVGIICYRRRHAAERQDPIGGQMDLNMIKTDDPSDSASAENPTCTELHEYNSPYETPIYNITDLVTVDDVVEFLKAKGFGQYAAAFKRHKIDGVAVMYLNDAVLAELVPEIGPRVKLQKALQELKDNQTYTSLLN